MSNLLIVFQRSQLKIYLNLHFDPGRIVSDKGWYSNHDMIYYKWNIISLFLSMLLVRNIYDFTYNQPLLTK